MSGNEVKVLVKGRWLTLSEATKLYSKPDTARKQSKLDRVGETLGLRARRTREYEVIREPEQQPRYLRGEVLTTGIPGSVYDLALRVEEEMLRRFKGKRLEEAIPGEIASNDQGHCYRVANECNAQFKKADYETSRKAILSDLKLIYGIGPATEQVLKREGYLTIEHLREHPRWQRSADEFLRMMEAKDIGLLQSWFWRRLPKSHPMAHCLAAFCEDEDFAVLDIETLGLSERPIILLGVAKPGRDKVCMSQFLLRDIPDEPGALREFISHIDEKAALVTFNGRSFDIPFIQGRLAFYGMETSLENPHFDLLHFARRAWQDRLDDCRLHTIEKYFGVQRDVDVPSALVPEFYSTYLRTGNVGPLVAIVEHNKQDLLTLASLFSKLSEEWRL